jgi:hypothetical protein
MHPPAAGNAPAPVSDLPPPDFSKLPPTVAASLARLAGRPLAPSPGDGGAAPRRGPGKPSES